MKMAWCAADVDYAAWQRNSLSGDAMEVGMCIRCPSLQCPHMLSGLHFSRVQLICVFSDGR